MASRERDVVYCRKYTLFCRQRNKWNSSYQSEENNNPGLDLPSPVNDRGNYAHILRQANRITVRFCLWLGCHPPPLLLWVLIDPLPLSLITLLSLSLPVLFHLFLCLNLLSLSPSTSVFLPCLFSRLMNLKLVGIVWSDETPPTTATTTITSFQPVQGLNFCSTVSSHPGQPREYSCPSLFHLIPANTFTTFKLATVTANHA